MDICLTLDGTRTYIVLATPDIINCNDWQTALVPVYLNLYYRHLDKFNSIRARTTS